MRRLRTRIRRRSREWFTTLLAVVAAVAAVGALVIHLTHRPPDSTSRQAALGQIERSYQVVEAALAARQPSVSPDTSLRGVAAAMTRTHRALAEGDEALGLQGAGTPAQALAFTSLDPIFDELATSAAAIAAEPTNPEALRDLLRHAGLYRQGMRDLVGVYDTERATELARRERLEMTAFGLVLLAALVLLGVSPLARRRSSAEAAARWLTRSLAEPDHLTGLPRRADLKSRLAAAITQAGPNERFVALLHIDVDDLAQVNARLGRDTGDRVLRAAAKRLRDTVRTSDMVARVGGDQFAVVLDGIQQPEDAGRVAEKILDVLRLPMPADDEVVEVTASVGIAVWPFDAEHSDELVDKAIVAMHAAKRAGRDCRVFFAPDVITAGRSVRVVDGLRAALDSGDQLWLTYQPKVALSDGATVGVEALIRWSHPQLGALLPEDFIGVAEETDLILDIGRWVFETAARQAAIWQRSPYGPLPVSVNVSPRQFRYGDLVHIVAEVLERYGLAPELLEIELTESVLVDDDTSAVATMQGLRALGLRISVDDFGTGYSSLSYLKRFPIDALKIDRSFIQELREGTEDAAISTAIIALAHSLDLEVVGEGVETEEQAAVLRSLGCDTVQGFLFARPMTAAAVNQYRQRHLRKSG